MKQRLKRIVRSMLSWPIIGYWVRIGVTIVRLPEMANSLLHFKTFASEQLPTMLHTLSELNQRCLVNDENPNSAIPEQLTRLHGQIEDLTNRLDFVCRELMFESHRDLPTAPDDKSSFEVTPQTQTVQKTEAASEQRQSK